MSAPRTKSAAPSRKGRIPAGEIVSRNARILDSATQVFLKCGFEKATMNAIAKKAGCSLETLYTAYPTKAKMFAALTTRKAIGLFEAIGPLNPSRNLQKPLVRFASEVLALMTKPETIELHRLVVGEARSFPELGKSFWDEGPGRGVSLLTDYFAAIKRLGKLPIQSPAQAAEVFIGLVLGATNMRATLGLEALIQTQKQQSAWAEYSVNLFLSLLRQGKL